MSEMPDKQKVTLYLPPGLHRQLKIRAAVEAESMSAMVERAIAFYLNHPDWVEEQAATQDNTYQVHDCPECNSSLVIKEGEAISLKHQPTVVSDSLAADSVPKAVASHSDSPGEGEHEELVPC